MKICKKIITFIVLIWFAFSITWISSCRHAARDTGKYLLDSIIITDKEDQYSSKNIFEYDEKGRTIKITLYYWSQDLREWIGYMGFESQYNENDSLIKSQRFFWNEENKTWEKWLPEEFIYENNRLVSKKEYKEGHIGLFMVTYFYDENGNKTKSLETNLSTNSRIVECEFDDKNNVISKIVSHRENYKDTTSAFLQENKTVFLYNRVYIE
jgi:hypothetical protein